MIRPPQDVDSVADYLDGEARAHTAVALIWGDPDALTRALANLLAKEGSRSTVTPRLLGFGRVIRKILERRI